MEHVRQASRTLGTKRRKCLEDKISELETNTKNKNIKDLYGSINELKEGYKPITKLVKDENSDLLADSRSN
jgi:hypothetical protein